MATISSKIKVSAKEWNWLQINKYVSSFWLEEGDATYYYFWQTLPWTTKWRIKRQAKIGNAIAYAHWESNWAAAWANMTAQTYNAEIT